MQHLAVGLSGEMGKVDAEGLTNPPNPAIVAFRCAAAAVAAPTSSSYNPTDFMKPGLDLLRLTRTDAPELTRLRVGRSAIGAVEMMWMRARDHTALLVQTTHPSYGVHFYTLPSDRKSVV